MTAVHARPHRSGLPSHRRAGGTSATRGVVDRVYGFLRAIPASVLWIIVVIWSLPTLGLLDQLVPRPRRASARRAGGTCSAELDELTLDNYRDGARAPSGTATLANSLLNSFAIAIPATIIPIAIAAFAAYALRLDRLQGPQVAVHRHGRRCWRSRCRSR